MWVLSLIIIIKSNLGTRDWILTSMGYAYIMCSQDLDELVIVSVSDGR